MIANNKEMAISDIAFFTYFIAFVYLSKKDINRIHAKWIKQKKNPYYKRFMLDNLKSSNKKNGFINNIIGIWDDHDYGLNNAGASLSFKDLSKRFLLEFLDEYYPNKNIRYFILDLYLCAFVAYE